MASQSRTDSAIKASGRDPVTVGADGARPSAKTRTNLSWSKGSLRQVSKAGCYGSPHDKGVNRAGTERKAAGFSELLLFQAVPKYKKQESLLPTRITK